MAKTTAPILSFGAAGQIGKTQVYARWRGVPYARRYIIPANPQSTEQSKTRNLFTTLVQMWKLMDGSAQAPWKAYATGKPLTDRNALLKFNIVPMRGETDFAKFIGSPGSGGGVPLTAFSASGGSGTISTTVTTPTPPTGWNIAAVGAVARVNDNPQTTTDYTTHYAEATSTPWQPSFSGLSAGSYVVVAWIKWTKPDGTTAYSVSSEHAATVT
jgi:hypothetical protein